MTVAAPPALRSLLELLWPTGCVVCGAAGGTLCAVCQGTLRWSARPCRPDPCPPGLRQVWAAAPYAGTVRRLLVLAKEHGQRPALQTVAEGLAVAVAAAVGSRPAGGVLLVPVPTRRSARRVRGEDSGRRLALATAGLLCDRRTPVRVVPALRHVRSVADQAGLAAADRWRNLAGALAVRPGPARRLTAAVSDGGAAVVLIDDVMTTGSTLAEAGRALASGGIPCCVAVVAATTRTGSSGAGGAAVAWQ